MYGVRRARLPGPNPASPIPTFFLFTIPVGAVVITNGCELKEVFSTAH